MRTALYSNTHITASLTPGPCLHWESFNFLLKNNYFPRQMWFGRLFQFCCLL